MRWISFLPLLALGSPALADVEEDPRQTIIVTGTALPNSERALRDCLARRCPPEEDIAATLVHAENQFVAGDYEGARRTLKASQGRNNRFASQFPVPVSYLYRAGSRVASHLGEGRDFEQSTWGIKRALKAGLPDDDARLIAADLEVAGMQAMLARPAAASRLYDEAISDARKIGRPDLAGIAQVRRAWLARQEGNFDLARRELREVAANRDPAARSARLAALVLLARIDRSEGKAASSDALIQELRSAGFEKPVLLFAPPIKFTTREGSQGMTSTSQIQFVSVTRLTATQNFDDRWVDVGFWITPEGRVNDAEILRSSGPTYWAKPVLASIQGRIYSPSASADSSGTYRVERYSFTSLWEDRTGTRLRQRSATARFEYLDLSADPAPEAN